MYSTGSSERTAPGWWVDDKGHEIITEDGRRAMISIMLDINETMRRQERLKQKPWKIP